MQITVSGKRIELSDVLRTRVWGELDAIGQRYVDMVTAQVTFSRERRFFTCEIAVHGANIRLRTSASAADAYYAFSKAVEPVAVKLAAERDRRYHRRTEPTAEIGFRSLLRSEPSEEGPEEEA